MADGWTILKSNLFDKQMKQYARNAEMLKKVDELLELFQQTDDPRRIGDRKSGKLNGLYAARLSKQNRLLYEVSIAKREVRLLSIGGHKQVYGRD